MEGGHGVGPDVQAVLMAPGIAVIDKDSVTVTSAKPPRDLVS